MKKIIITTLCSLMTLSAQAALINKPVLMPNGGKVASCLEKVVRFHISIPGDNSRITEWRGPGVKADSTGTVDPTTAVQLFKVSPGEKWYAIAFFASDDLGWRLFSYEEEGQLKIGYRAASMESTGALFGVSQRSLAREDDEIETTEIDLTPCAGLFIK